MSDISIIKEDNQRRELILFCNLLSTACKTDQSLAKALAKNTNEQKNSRCAVWASSVARNLQDGYSLEECASQLSGFDPVLAQIMPLLGERKLIKILDLYSRFLLKLDMCNKQIRLLTSYPMLIIGFAIAFIVYLNFSMFPEMVQIFGHRGFAENWTMYLFYFADFYYWPMSLIIPAILLYLGYEAARIAFSGSVKEKYFWSRITGLSEADLLNRKARVIALMSLYLKAGYSLNDAISTTAQLASEEEKKDILNAEAVLRTGASYAEAIGRSEILGEVLNGNENSEELPDKLDCAFNGLNDEAIFKIKNCENRILYISIFLAAIVVLVVALGAYGSYSLFARAFLL